MATKLDAAWIAKFLRRQEKTKAGKQHLTATRNLGALISWLLEQKAPAKASSR